MRLRCLAFLLPVGLIACTPARPTPAQPRLSCPAAPACEPAVAFEPAEPCATTARQDAIVTTGDDKLSLAKASFGDLPGWKKDKHGEALPAFLASCGKLAKLDDDTRVGTGPFGGQARDWRKACAAAALVQTGSNKAARLFFENQFDVYAASGNSGPKGKITGYYVQPLRGSRKRGGQYQFPLYRRPADLVSVPLSDFVSDGRSRRVWGRASSTGKKLLPYPTRAEFRKEMAANRKSDHVLLWLDSPAAVVQVEIEGSGRATLDDGSTVMVAFAGKNGRPSGRLGTIARGMRKFEKAHAGTPWRKADLARYHKLADRKTSMVFFEIESRSGAIGTQNVVLTPRRSLAVDRAIISLSTPVWVDTRAPSKVGAASAPWRHLLIAQDTGGAIVGTIRGDIYWGDDADAVALGKRVNNPGRMWLLLPRGLKVLP